jgi:hypothetical protein
MCPASLSVPTLQFSDDVITAGQYRQLGRGRRARVLVGKAQECVAVVNSTLDDLCTVVRLPTISSRLGSRHNSALDGPLVDYRSIRCGDIDPDRALFTLHALRVGCDSADSSMLLAEELVGQELDSLSRTYERMFAATNKQNQLRWMENSVASMSTRVKDLLARIGAYCDEDLRRTMACPTAMPCCPSVSRWCSRAADQGTEGEPLRRVVVVAESAVGG